MNALLTYRRLTETDIPTFVAMRITQLKEEGAQSDLDLEPALTTYYQKHLTDGTFVSWLAVDGERIIGTSGMSFVENHRIRNGCAVVYCVWIREKRTFFAVCVVMRSEKVLHISKVF